MNTTIVRAILADDALDNPVASAFFPRDRYITAGYDVYRTKLPGIYAVEVHLGGTENSAFPELSFGRTRLALGLKNAVRYGRESAIRLARFVSILDL